MMLTELKDEVARKSGMLLTKRLMVLYVGVQGKASNFEACPRRGRGMLRAKESSGDLESVQFFQCPLFLEHPHEKA